MGKGSGWVKKGCYMVFCGSRRCLYVALGGLRVVALWRWLWFFVGKGCFFLSVDVSGSLALVVVVVRDGCSVAAWRWLRLWIG